jgi:4-diphosphocytidyl-2-C-methyl-D-erythritol kinase
MLIFPNAKINIGLNITEKRPDGFHNIESCFYPVGWSDALEITPADRFSFHTEGMDIPSDGSENLCEKAYRLLAADYPLAPVQMHLLKNIPVGAGLGGGSADAAFTITALNQYFGLKISFEKQLDYARRLGSDCAFFILNKPAYCFEKGDRFENIELDLSGKWIVMVNPRLHISTAEAYAGIRPQQTHGNLRILLSSPLSQWKNGVKNDFEATIFPKYPLLQEIKDHLYQYGALYAAMSGSGSTMYGIFETEINLRPQFEKFMVWQGFLG